MARFCVILLFFLFHTNLFAMVNSIKGNLFIWQKKAWPASKQEAEKLTKILGIHVPAKSLLVWVCAENEEYTNWNLNKDYAEITNFPRNLPICILEGKHENDIVELIIDNTRIELCCSQSKQSHGIQFQDFLKSLTKTTKKVHFWLS